MENRRVLIRKGIRVAATLLLTVSVGGCAQTVVQPKYEQRTAGPIVRPSQVLVYDFTITAADVSEKPRIFATVPNSRSDHAGDHRELATARAGQKPEVGRT